VGGRLKAAGGGTTEWRRAAKTNMAAAITALIIMASATNATGGGAWHGGGGGGRRIERMVCWCSASAKDEAGIEMCSASSAACASFLSTMRALPLFVSFHCTSGTQAYLAASAPPPQGVWHGAAALSALCLAAW